LSRAKYLHDIKRDGFAAAGPGSWPSAPPGHLSSLVRPRRTCRLPFCRVHKLGEVTLAWVPGAFVGLVFVAALVAIVLSSRRSSRRLPVGALGPAGDSQFRGSVLWSAYGLRGHGGTPLWLDFYQHGVCFRPRISLLRAVLPTIELLYSEIEFVDAVTLPLVYVVFSGTGVRVKASPLVPTVVVFMSGDWSAIIEEFPRHGVDGRRVPIKAGVWTLGEP